MKTHKRKKSSREKGNTTAGWGARKKHKDKGHKGGKGMSGTGKRSGQKITLVNKLYGNKYFGKQGITSRGTERDKGDRINLNNIQSNLETYEKKGIAKKISGGYEINLPTYKILGTGDISTKFGKLIIKAKEASKSAIDKIKKAGGEIQLSIKKEIKTPLVQNKKKVKLKKEEPIDKEEKSETKESEDKE